MKRVFIFVAVVVALCVAGAGLALSQAVARVRGEGEAFEARVAAGFAEHGPAWLADQKELAGHWLLQAGQERDAGALLNAALPWRGEAPAVKAWSGAHPPRFVVSDKLHDALSSWSKEWPQHAADPLVLTADVAWLKELRAFDHWDIEKNSPNEGTKQTYVELPDFVSMRDAAKIRLLQGMARGDVLEASADVRSLARLSVSTENLIGAMLGVAFAMLERDAFDAAVVSGVDVTGWVPDTTTTLDHLRRALFAAPGAFSLLTPSGFDADAIVVGRCAGLQESLTNALVLKELIEWKRPERYAALTRALDAAPCRLTRLRRQWPINEGALKNDKELFCLAAGGDVAEACEVPAALAHAPFVADLAGEVLLTVAMPDYFNKYREGTVKAP